MVPKKRTGTHQGARTGHDGDPTTLTRQARRAQLIEVTVQLVADRGYAGVSLGGIAERAGITKAAVLYHFPSKNDVVRAAYQHVITTLTDEVAAAVEAAPAADGPAAYARSMIGHLCARPRHTRMIIEALTQDDSAPDTAARWGPVARILEEARRARGLSPGRDNRTTALIIGGAIDSIVHEQLHDPDYDTTAATEQLVDLIEHTFLRA